MSEPGRLPRLGAGEEPGAPGALLPERVVQFGEGNFLRGFVDWMIQRMNARGLFQGRVVVVQPIPAGMGGTLNAQAGRYTVVLRGLVDDSAVDDRLLVSAISRCVNPYQDWDAFIACAANPDLRFVVSNTTEAGIRVDPDDAPDARPSTSFPGKLTQLLHARFQHFAGDRARGLVMLPCELIEDNGGALRRAVGELGLRWRLGAAFSRWVDEACVFASTLVDRIVTGFPKSEAPALWAELGYEDPLLVAAEPFHAWVIESPRAPPGPLHAALQGQLEDELPLRAAGLDVTFTDDLRPYRERKVRILNGAHTMTALCAYLGGKDTVRAFMDDPLFRRHVERGIADEILPTLALPRAELEAFARSVSERFRNPFIEHQLLSIALNSVSKYRARILPVVVDHLRLTGRLPPRLSFALAALAVFYRGQELRDGALIGVRAGREYRIQDDAAVLSFFRDAWRTAWPAAGAPPSTDACQALVRALLARADFWGGDVAASLPGFDVAVAQHLGDICGLGVRAALERIG